MKRKITKLMKTWKEHDNKKAFLLLGARQVGKTYAIREFAKENYQNILEINFEKEPFAKTVFENFDSFDTLLTRLSSLALTKGIRNIKGKESLIFFDEIQACPAAITTIKFFVENGDYNVIASGSLLGVALKRTTSYPVGYIKECTLYPFDFEEFLWANGISDEVIASVKKAFLEKRVIDNFFHDLLNKMLINYIVVGGMPSVITTFLKDKNMANVYEEQKSIIQAYRKDIDSHLSNNDLKIKVFSCFDSIPEQLAKENKKFQYKLIKQGGNARYFDSSIDWIVQAGLAHKCTRLTSIQSPISLGKNSAIFKLYFNDIGLLVSMYDPILQASILNGDLGIFKGAIFEQLVAQMLVANNKSLFYYEENPVLEIDFIIDSLEGPLPIEVKSSGNTKSKSLISFISKFNSKKAIKLSTNNINCNNPVIECFPIYITMFLWN